MYYFFIGGNSSHVCMGTIKEWEENLKEPSKEPFRNSNSDHVDDSIMGKVIEKQWEEKTKQSFSM